MNLIIWALIIVIIIVVIIVVIGLTVGLTKKPALSNYVLVPGTDSRTSENNDNIRYIPDTERAGKTLDEWHEYMAKQCDADPSCAGFLSTGWLKKTIVPEGQYSFGDYKTLVPNLCTDNNMCGLWKRNPR